MVMRLTAILIVATFLLAGCASNYDEYARAKKEFAQTESIRMKENTKVVMGTIKILTQGFEEVAEGEQPPAPPPLFEKSYIDAKGNMVTETVYDNSGKVFEYLKEKERVQIVKDLMPMVEKMYVQQQLNMEAPVTSGQVALAFVNQIPFMATVAGMYGLGVKGMEEAGDNIVANVDNGSSYANNGSSISTSSSSTSNSGESITTNTERLPE